MSWSLLLVHTGLDIMSEFADCVRSAPLAVTHLLDIFPALVLHFAFHLLGWRGDIGKLVLGD
jgi:hypothetical protein